MFCSFCDFFEVSINVIYIEICSLKDLKIFIWCNIYFFEINILVRKIFNIRDFNGEIGNFCISLLF